MRGGGRRWSRGPVDPPIDRDNLARPLGDPDLEILGLEIGNRWSMVALSDEASTAYADLLGLREAWPVSCVGDVYGYRPTEAQRRA